MLPASILLACIASVPFSAAAYLYESYRLNASLIEFIPDNSPPYEDINAMFFRYTSEIGSITLSNNVSEAYSFGTIAGGATNDYIFINPALSLGNLGVTVPDDLILQPNSSGYGLITHMPASPRRSEPILFANLSRELHWSYESSIWTYQPPYYNLNARWVHAAVNGTKTIASNLTVFSCTSTKMMYLTADIDAFRRDWAHNCGNAISGRLRLRFSYPRRDE